MTMHTKLFVYLFLQHFLEASFKSPITGPFFDKIYNEFKYSVFREEKKLAHDEFSDQLPEQENEMLLRENKRLRSFLYKTI